MQERLWSGYFNARSSGVKLFSDIFRSDGLKTPAWLKTRLTLDGLAAATFASSIMKVKRRYHSGGFFAWKSKIALRSGSSSQ